MTKSNTKVIKIHIHNLTNCYTWHGVISQWQWSSLRTGNTTFFSSSGFHHHVAKPVYTSYISSDFSNGQHQLMCLQFRTLTRKIKKIVTQSLPPGNVLGLSSTSLTLCAKHMLSNYILWYIIILQANPFLYLTIVSPFCVVCCWYYNKMRATIINRAPKSHNMLNKDDLLLFKHTIFFKPTVAMTLKDFFFIWLFILKHISREVILGFAAFTSGLDILELMICIDCATIPYKKEACLHKKEASSLAAHIQ